jgi:hypothetical protein
MNVYTKKTVAKIHIIAIRIIIMTRTKLITKRAEMQRSYDYCYFFYNGIKLEK